MIINHNREKLFNLIAYFVTKTKYCGITKLFKLLFFADFKSFKELGQSMTGLSYYTWDKGPAPVELFHEFKNPPTDFKNSFSVVKLEDSERLDIKPKIHFNPAIFNKKEIQILEQLALIYEEAYAKDMVEITHLKNSPWDKTLKMKGKNMPIDYMLAFDGEKEALSAEQYDEIRETQRMMVSILSKCKKAK